MTKTTQSKTNAQSEKKKAAPSKKYGVCAPHNIETVKELKKNIKRHIVSTLAKDIEFASISTYYKATAYAIRDLLIDRWLKTQRTYYGTDTKRVYFLSLEFLTGRTLGNSLINMGMMNDCCQAMHELGLKLEEIREVEWDAGLGNGGLGRLAACFLDSLATLEIPSYGYGIHYEFGIFNQKIIDGYQVEMPDNWLRYGNPWEFTRPEDLFQVQFYGSVTKSNGKKDYKYSWVDTEEVCAVACDTPVPGYNNNHVINMRLWAAKSTREFDLQYFNEGNYIQAVEQKRMSETISSVLYPNDHMVEGRELRLKQQYFLVSATLQDIMRRYKKNEKNFDNFTKQVAVQLNDTHPTLAIPELMRILVDIEGLEWEKAWEVTVNTFGYTNHTLLPEALEKWSVSLLERVLPRHILIIYEINQRFLKEVSKRFPGDLDKITRMSIIEEGDEKMVRMAFLAIIGSHSVNGVSALHSRLLTEAVFKDFFEFSPTLFNNKTNGITQRRWLKKANPGLSELITNAIGDKWASDLYELKKLIPLAHDKAFKKEWRAVKGQNKKCIARYIKENNGIDINVNSILDVQVKRMHEYKRQLLNVFHVITLYNKIKENPGKKNQPRTVVFGGKAAPAYWMAKLIIKLINSVADIVNNDIEVGDKLKVIFLDNYRVSLAEKIIPASDLSEQISTAGKEASGTGNMKFALNGALTIGTLDGANIEILEEVGKENIFIFGLKADEVMKLKHEGYNPSHYYEQNKELKKVITMIHDGYFSPFAPDLFKPVVDSLLVHGDHFMVLADYQSYIECQEKVNKTFANKDLWDQMSILNTANMGKFSSDRCIKEYAEEIWHAKPVHVE